jgi:ethanolamine utilization microcompartment shell protein EutS
VEDAAMVAGYVAITEAVVRFGALRRWAGVKAVELSAVSGEARAPAP